MPVNFDDLPVAIRSKLIADGVAPAPRSKRVRRTVTAEWTYRCVGPTGCGFEVTSRTETIIERHCRAEGHSRYELVLTPRS